MDAEAQAKNSQRMRRRLSTVAPLSASLYPVSFSSYPRHASPQNFLLPAVFISYRNLKPYSIAFILEIILLILAQSDLWADINVLISAGAGFFLFFLLPDLANGNLLSSGPAACDSAHLPGIETRVNR